jgi:hypothetical protein
MALVGVWKDFSFSRDGAFYFIVGRIAVLWNITLPVVLVPWMVTIDLHLFACSSSGMCNAYKKGRARL